MIGRFNFLWKSYSSNLLVAVACVMALSVHAQRTKKKLGKEPTETTYAYQTLSTLGKKQKIHSHGTTDPKFMVEKPVRPTPYRNGRAVYTRSDSFGPKNQSGRRSTSKPISKNKPRKKRGKK